MLWGTAVAGSGALVYSYNYFLSPEQAANAQQSLLNSFEGVANQNAAVSPEYEHQQKREREIKEKRDQEQANITESIDTNILGNMPNGDPAPKRDPKGGLIVKIGFGVSGVGFAVASVKGIVDGTRVPEPPLPSNQPEVKPYPQEFNWLQFLIDLFI